MSLSILLLTCSLERVFFQHLLLCPRYTRAFFIADSLPSHKRFKPKCEIAKTHSRPKQQFVRFKSPPYFFLRLSCATHLLPSYYHWFVNGQELDAQSGQADKGQTPNMAIRLKTLARCMSINKHKAMEYIDEQSALEAEQSMQQTDLTKDVELVA